MPTTSCTRRDGLCLHRWLAPACCLTALLAASALAKPPSVGVSINAGIEVETRGPVHEAFAEPLVYDPDPGLVVPEEPPPAIDEVPPDERPEGEFITWIPGYWSWDDDRRAFLWVSGLWRSLPPGRQFIPGYWVRTPGGYQWVPGAWLGAGVQTVEYLPEPPAPISIDPVGVPPAPDYVWVPGVWRWQHGGYAWRPGYWLAPQPAWAWVPAHYVWTPSGFLYVSGYWDYAMPRRGVLFAPVYFDRAVIARRGFAYTPTVVIEANLLVDHLFARPCYRHYYFGDYYASEYRRFGIIPVYEFHHGHHGYSPLFAQALAAHRRGDPGWERRGAHEYEVRRDHPDARPPRTWAAVEKLRAERPGPQDAARPKAPFIARPLTELVGGRDSKDKDAPFRFQRTAPEQRDEFRQKLTQLRDVQTQRQQIEHAPAAPSPADGAKAGPGRMIDQPPGVRTGQQQPKGRTVSPGQQPPPDRQAQPGQKLPPGPQVQPGQKPPSGLRAQPGQKAPPPQAQSPRLLTLPRSPVVGRPIKDLDSAAAPPARPQAPKADPKPKAQPQPRVAPRERTPGNQDKKGGDKDKK